MDNPLTFDKLKAAVSGNSAAIRLTTACNRQVGLEARCFRRHIREGFTLGKCADSRCSNSTPRFHGEKSVAQLKFRFYAQGRALGKILLDRLLSARGVGDRKRKPT